MRPGASCHDAGQWRGKGLTGTISSQLHEGDERLRKECITAPMADGETREMRFGLAALRRCTVHEPPPTYNPWLADTSIFYDTARLSMGPHTLHRSLFGGLSIRAHHIDPR